MPLELDRIQGVCFDVDGTLCDTDDMWVQKVEKIMRPFKRIFGRGDTRPFARRLIMAIESPGNLAYHLLDRLGLDDEAMWVLNRLAKLNGGRPHGGYWLIPGVKELLYELNALYPMAVVSARGDRGTLAFLNQFSLLPYFKVVITSQTCRYTKPYPDPVIKAAQEMGLRPEECLMVGDTTVDIRAGRAAGAQTAGLLCGFGQEKELRRAGADVILEGPSDLLRLFIK